MRGSNYKRLQNALEMAVSSSAANSKGNGQSKQKPNGKKIIPKTIPDPSRG